MKEIYLIHLRIPSEKDVETTLSRMEEILGGTAIREEDMVAVSFGAMGSEEIEVSPYERGGYECYMLEIAEPVKRETPLKEIKKDLFSKFEGEDAKFIAAYRITSTDEPLMYKERSIIRSKKEHIGQMRDVERFYREMQA